MQTLYETQRLKITEATPSDIPYIMDLERQPENRDYVFQGTYEDHLQEINSPEKLLALVTPKTGNLPKGFFIAVLDPDSHVLELKRIVIETKNQGFGREVILGLMAYAFTTLDINRLWLDVFTDNPRGIHLYESLGMVSEGTKRQAYLAPSGEYKSQIIYSLLREEFH
ncbi:MAG: hypothetical protein AVO33_04410 [delta proteobacterium ML8_F1]|nr:MAG: hypothetical protein AVO33_04410 [delta proteobacterium ML8_F1]